MALDDILRYESAAVAANSMKTEKNISVIAMENLYKTILGKDSDDPIYKNALAEANAGIESEAGITNLGVAQAIGIYNQKYTVAFASTKISDVTKYLTDGFKISDEVKSAFEAYKDMTVLDIETKLEDKETSKEDKEALDKAMKAIGMLQGRRLRAKTLDIYNNVIKQNLEGLYPKKEEKKA
jgi:hypothetical protein